MTRKHLLDPSRNPMEKARPPDLKYVYVTYCGKHVHRVRMTRDYNLTDCPHCLRVVQARERREAKCGRPIEVKDGRHKELP
jgi:hypothetical protein